MVRRFHDLMQARRIHADNQRVQSVNDEMTSIERHEARYQRRKAERMQKAAERSEQYTKWEDVYGFAPLIQGYCNTSKASKKRGTTQRWMADLAVNTAEEKRKLDCGIWKSRGFNNFRIKERGKWRDISSVHISEKGVQNTLSNNCLIPIIRPHLIYDNGASLKGKGTDFALRRFVGHLRSHIRRHGRDGGIYFFDFSNYFASIMNVPLKTEVRKLILDERIFKTYAMFVDAFGEIGLGLGSQVSQISAVFYPNRLDHYMKDELGVAGYAHYMDDGYIIHYDLDELKSVVGKFEVKAAECGIKLNRKKCRIIKLTKQFVFLKTRFFITESGKVISRLNRKAAQKERHRLKAYRKFVDMGLMTEREVYLNFHSWLLSLNRGKSFHAKLNAIRYYNSLFPNYWPTKTKTRKQKELAYIAKGAIDGKHKRYIGGSGHS